MAPKFPGRANRARRKDNPEGRMSLVEHLLEFRTRLVRCAVAVLLGAIAGWFLFDFVYEHLTAPIADVRADSGENAMIALNYAGLTSAFSQRVNLAVWVGLILAGPVMLYQIWAYVVPALTRKERRYSQVFLVATIPLFLTGCLFGYWILPKAVAILLSFTPDDAANLPEAAAYFRFVTRLILVFGVTWVFPVFLVGLIAVGAIPGRSLLRQWRPALIVIFIVSAVVTPTPDPLTMFAMAAPLIVLYFVAAGLGIWIDRRRERNRPEWTEVADDQASAL